MRPSVLYANGKYRVVNIPSLGAYDLVTGQGYSGSGQYSKSPWAFACMNIRASSLGQIPWRIVKKDTDDVVEGHLLYDMLNAWADGRSWAAELAASEFDLCLNGAAFWLKNGSELQRLNPNTITVNTSPRGVTGFTQRILTAGKQEERTFPREAVIYFREFHPTDDLGKGVPMAEVCKQAILAEYESARYIKSFFENDALPGLLIHTEQVVPQSEMTKLETWWKSKFGGASKHHQPAFVDKGLEAQVLSSNLGEMALEEVRDQARRDICTAFHVPMVLVGDLDAANFATAHEARIGMIEETIIPRADAYADVINAELVREIDESVEFQFATDDLDILQEDENAKAERLKGLVDANIISKETARAELGYSEEDAPDEDEIPEEVLTTPFRAWRRKALNALKAGKPADVPFDTPDLSPALVGAIRARLGQARTPADVTAIFRQW